MQRSWNGRNVDLALFTACISDFFKEKDFEVVNEEISTGYQILAEGPLYIKLLGYLTVTIEGSPDDFAVKIDRRREKTHHMFSPLLLNMFGGGYLFLQKLKSDEAWIKLTREFWEHVENTVLHLTNTAETPNKGNNLSCNLRT